MLIVSPVFTNTLINLNGMLFSKSKILSDIGQSITKREVF